MDGHRRSSEQVDEAIVDASPDAIFLANTDGQISYANYQASDLFGYDAEELVGSQVERLIPEDRRDTHVDDREAYVKDPKTRPMGASLDLYARRKDETTFPVEISLSPVEIADETYVIVAVRDVSEQDAFRTKFRTILEAVPDAIVVADATTGVIVATSERVADLWGYESEELVGTVQTTLHPAEDRAQYRDLFERHVSTGQAIFTTLSDGSDIHVETVDGELIPVEINAHTFELGDRRLIASVFRDVTARKKREQALEQLHTASRDLMAATDTEEVASIASETAMQVLDLPMNGVHLYDSHSDALVPVAWSDSTEAAFGDVPPSIPAGEGLAWIAYASGESDAYANVLEADRVLNEETAFRSELYLPLGDHGVLVVGSTVVGDFDATDEALAQVLASNVEAALDRVEREEELKHQNEQLNDFASIVSHDLRNPLNVATGRLDLARQEIENEHLDAVARAHDRMEELIGDLLTLARQGETVADAEGVGLAELVESCWQHVETEAATVVVDANHVVRADESRLRQLMENLVRNAVEHGGRAVTVRVGTLDRDGFYVEDDGPGIPEEKRETVFEAGYSTGDAGTGIGLAIVGQIALAHGWDVTVTEADGGGTRFEITGVEFER